MSRVGYLGLTCGIRLVSHYTGESGGGKSSVDQIFGICKEELKRRVTKGQGDLDITDAISLAKVLNYKPLKKTVSYAVTFLRGKVLEPSLNKSAKDGRLQSQSTRHYSYDTDGYPLEVVLQDQSFLPESGLQKKITLQSVWSEELLFPFPEIIPTVMKIDCGSKGAVNISGVEEIFSATSNFVSKVEKDSNIQQRKEENDRKSDIAAHAKKRYEMMWSARSANYAKSCGLQSYLLCGTVGCIRQFSCHQRLQQHELSGSHQSNGNPRSQSSNAVAPNPLDGFTVKELALNYLILKVGNTANNSDKIETAAAGHKMRVEVISDDEEVKCGEEQEVLDNNQPRYDADIERAAPKEDDEEVQENADDVIEIQSTESHASSKFGWAKRVTLKHPGFSPAMSEFLKWIFNRGNEKGNSKSSPSAMLSQAANYGMPSLSFADDPFWNEAVERSGGQRIFTSAEIPEEWQVKQYVCQLSTTVKQKQKASAGVQVLSPEVKLQHLTSHLGAVSDIPLEPSRLAQLIIDIGIDLTTILQKDLKEIMKLAVFTPVCKRAVIEACKKVGRILPDLNNAPYVQLIQDEIDENIEGEAVAQDAYDIEHNCDDADVD